MYVVAYEDVAVYFIDDSKPKLMGLLGLRANVPGS